MKDNRITGLIAIKDGKVVLEKYALGRKPEQTAGHRSRSPSR